MASSSVWVQLYWEDGKKGSLIDQIYKSDLKPGHDWNIASLKGLVKDKMAVALSHCDAAELVVYPPESESSGSNQKKYEYDPDKASASKPWDPIPSLGLQPWIVVAPNPNPTPAAAAADILIRGCVTKRPGDGSDARPLKRICTGENEKFFECLPKGQFRDGVVKFKNTIADGRVGGIYERPCFPELRIRVEQCVAEMTPDGYSRAFSSVIITGSSGVGKTCFGFYLAHQLVSEGNVVLYNYRNSLRAVFAPQLGDHQQSQKDTQTDFLMELRKKYNLNESETMDEECEKDDTNQSHFWGLVDMENKVGKELWAELKSNKETWLLVDLHSGDDYTEGREKCKIVVTSTMRKGKWPLLDSGGATMSKRLYMPPLSLLEAKSINEKLDLKISDAVIEERFEAFGGSARFLLNEGGQQKVDDAFFYGNLTELVNPDSEHPTRSSAVVHILADKHFERKGHAWASQKIAERVVDSAIENKETHEKIWLEATRGKCGKGIMSARGIFAERLWHKRVKSGATIRLKELKETALNSEIKLLQLTQQFKRTIRFSKSDLSDLHELKIGEYALPDNDQFPDVDAIAVLDQDPWAASTEDKSSPKSGNKCICVLLQMAIGSSHQNPMGQTLINIDKKMGKLVDGYTSGESGSPIYLIFVTESADNWKFHQYHTQERKVYRCGKPKVLKKIQQFAVSFNPGV